LAITRWHDQTITFNQRPKIGGELRQTIASEVASYPFGLTRKQKQYILFNVNSLAIDLHLEKNNYLQSIEYVLRAFLISPSFHSLLQISQKYTTYLKKHIKLVFKKRKSVIYTTIKVIDTSKQRTHWSSFTKSEVNKNCN
jgi:predicted transcriptional regulator